MFLFRIINLNVSGVFVYLSYSAIFFIYFVFCLFTFFGLSMWTFTFDFLSILLILLILIFSLSFLFLDILTDNLYGINDTTSLYRTMQYCFLWFILSEAALFLSFFWAAFALNLLVTLEFSTIVTVLPTMFSNTLVYTGFIFYWFYLDLFNIIINTFFLFFSGIFCNGFYIFLNCNSLNFSIILCFMSLLLGFLFIWNQLWEFSLLTFTASTNSFCSTLFGIDLLHFSHVSLGVFLLFMCSVKLLNQQISHIKIVFITCVILYWHFVDLVWFLLLRFLYFSMLCTLFLL